MTSTPFRQRLALQLLAKRNQLHTAGAKGFTLIELLVVIVILGVLGSVGYQAYLAQIARANAGIAANTATAIAKNCAALATTGDESNFDTDNFAGTDVDVSGASTCPTIGTQQTFTVAVGAGTNTRTATATLETTGAVNPAPVPTS